MKKQILFLVLIVGCFVIACKSKPKKPTKSYHYYMVKAYEVGDYKRDYRDYYKKVILNYDSAILLRPDSTEAYQKRAEAKFRLQDFLGALKDYNKIVKSKPNSREGYYRRGLTKYLAKDYKGALEDMEKSIQLNQVRKWWNYAGEYNLKGMINYSLSNYKAMLNDFSKSIELYPDNYVAFYNRGIAKLILKDYKGAIRDLYLAEELYPICKGMGHEKIIYKEDFAIKLEPEYEEVCGYLAYAKAFYETSKGDYKSVNDSILYKKDSLYYFLKGNARKGQHYGSEIYCPEWKKASALGYKGADSLIKRYCK